MAVEPTFKLDDPKVPLKEGAKFDQDKVRLDLIPGGALWELGKVYTYGATNKYAPYNWAKGIAYSRVYGAMMRHAVKWFWGCVTNDPETRCHHLASVAWCAFTLMHYDQDPSTYQQFDDRPFNAGLVGAVKELK